MKITNKQLRGDRIISLAVTIQSLLVVLQTVLICYFHMDASQTTLYRVVLTAVPMILAIIIAFSRRTTRFVVGYLITIFLLLITIAFHPDNTPFVISQGTRFLLPVVLPSFLCLTTLRDYEVFEKTLYVVSWATLAFVLLYVFGFFTGVFFISDYNMPFSFACVLPFVSFYSHRKYYDWIVCILLFVVVLAIGARGAALCMAAYVIVDLFQHKSKWRIAVLIAVVAFVILLPLINTWLDSVNITSRTLNKLYSGDITTDTGRYYIRRLFLSELADHPLLGLGLFGDRLHDDIVYCHNLLLEIALDFGIPLGFFLIIWGMVKLVSLYRRVDSEKRNQILKYFCALVLPFMTSSSYLIDSNFAIFVGICYLINKERSMQ